MASQELLPGRRHAVRDLGDVVVLGLGKTGRVVADYCLGLLGTRVRSLSVWAGEGTPAARKVGAELAERGAKMVFDSQQVEGSFDLCVASPGIPEPSPFYQSGRRASREVVSEVELAWRESRTSTTWVAVTGTNGKTTTTSLIAHVLKGCGMDAVAVGNIGRTCLSAVAADEADVLVAETSSFQLASCSLFAPDVAVLLNVTPDHVEWHKTLEAYVAAKMNILANLGASHATCAVLDATNDVVRKKVRELHAQGASRGFPYIPVGTADGYWSDMRGRCGSENAALVRDGRLTVAWKGEEHALCRVADLKILGEHNVGNALAAASAAVALGADDDGVAKSLASFKPLPHRLEPCGSVNGVDFFNDSKATNVDATLKALSAFGDRRPIVLLGGHDKGTDLAPLVEKAQKHCKAAVCFGAAGPRFAKAFEGSSLPTSLVEGGMEAALDKAVSIADKGDVVLLSPACSSFDEFSCYEERGDVFKRLVADRARKAQGGQAAGSR